MEFNEYSQYLEKLGFVPGVSKLYQILGRFGNNIAFNVQGVSRGCLMKT